MLDQITEKLMPYLVEIIPTDIHKSNPEGVDIKDPICEPSSFQKRFMTKRAFEKFISQLEDGNNNLYRFNILASSRPDEQTYMGIPDLSVGTPGDFSIEIPAHYKQFFPEYRKS